MIEASPPRAPYRDQPATRSALLIIDMINLFDFGGGSVLQAKAERASEAILGLKSGMSAAGLPTIYVNDNFGAWHSEKSRLVEMALDQPNRVSERLRPAEEDYFVLKPKFSGFYATNLPVLLPKLGVRRLILTGIATDICVLFTAADAHMRDYDLWIPQDCVAAIDDASAANALQTMATSMSAEIASSQALSLASWLGSPGQKADR